MVFSNIRILPVERKAHLRTPLSTVQINQINTSEMVFKKIVITKVLVECNSKKYISERSWWSVRKKNCLWNNLFMVPTEEDDGKYLNKNSWFVNLWRNHTSLKNVDIKTICVTLLLKISIKTSKAKHHFVALDKVILMPANY